MNFKIAGPPAVIFIDSWLKTMNHGKILAPLPFAHHRPSSKEMPRVYCQSKKLPKTPDSWFPLPIPFEHHPFLPFRPIPIIGRCCRSHHQLEDGIKPSSPFLMNDAIIAISFRRHYDQPWPSPASPSSSSSSIRSKPLSLAFFPSPSFMSPNS